MKRRCIAIDLDGTLLQEGPTKNRYITPQAAQAIIKLQKMGHVVVLATARHQKNVQSLIDDVNEQLDEEKLACPIIGSGGATIHNEQGEIIAPEAKPFYHTIEPTDVQKLMAILKERNISYFMSNSDGSWLFFEGNTKLRSDTRHPRIIQGKFEEVDQEILQVMAFPGNPEMQQSLKKAIGDAGLNLSAVSSNNRNLEIQHPAVSKGEAMRALAHHLKIPLKHCIAFGDSLNDQSIFNVVGRSFAMPHAPQELKATDTIPERLGKPDYVAIELEKLAQQ